MHFLLAVLIIGVIVAGSMGNVLAIKESHQNRLKTTSQPSFTLNEIMDAAARVKTFSEINHRLPESVQISSRQVSMPDFLRLMVACTLQINSGKSSSIELKSVKLPNNPLENIKDGNIYKTEYLDIAQRTQAFIDSNGIAPNYVNSSCGQIRFENLVYTYSKILSYYKSNKKLPNYVSVSKWNDEQSPDLSQYLKPTLNCQSTSSEIISKSNTITKSSTSNYNKAMRIFNWVRDHVTYSFYYNTKYGALGTLNSRKGNCCDHSHLFVALSRAVGLPARYVHGNCTFSSGNRYGHVWAQVYINNKWYNADAISSGNSLGVINNWNTKTANIDGYYGELAF